MDLTMKPKIEITADEARMITKDTLCKREKTKEEYIRILEEVKIAALKGNSQLDIDCRLLYTELNYFKLLGYEVTPTVNGKYYVERIDIRWN